MFSAHAHTKYYELAKVVNNASGIICLVAYLYSRNAALFLFFFQASLHTKQKKISGNHHIIELDAQ